MGQPTDEGIAGEDHRTRRCPMLGHSLSFSYCRTQDSEQPCRKIFDCWWEEFDIVAFVETNFGKDAISRITAPPRGKVLSLLELIERARKSGGGD